MSPARLLPPTLFGLLLIGLPAFAAVAADKGDDDLVQTVVNLVSDKDADVRAVGLEQVREQAQGEAATLRFAALLPTLPPDAQAGLLAALGDRRDKAARPAVLRMLDSAQQRVKVAAIGALGPLGDAGDVPLLAGLLRGPEAEHAAAHGALAALAGREASAAMAAAVPKSPAKVRAELIELLASRHAIGRETLAVLVPAACGDPDLDVSLAACAALGQLASPEDVPDLLKLVLAAPKGPRRDAAEKAVMFVCARIADAPQRAAPVLAVLKNSPPDEQTALLPTLGRVGGDAARKVVEAAIAQTDPRRHAAGFRALCNWPDASVASRLLDLAQNAPAAAEREMARAALIRVAPLPDKRPGAEKLALLKKAMALAANDAERNLIIKRARAVRTIDTLRFVLPYLDQPPFAQTACDTVVELAHHKELRLPNKAEFDQALDAVIRTGKDAKLIDRAKRYKKGQTL